MIIDLSNKRAIVTGSTAGIGFAIARGLAQAGAAVVINGRSRDSVAAAVERLKGEVPRSRVEGIPADLARADGVADFVRQGGDADILVNNLGIFEPKPFEAISDDDWHRFFDTNVMSGIRLSRHYLPKMLQRDWGRIVFISSESGLNIPVEMIHYGMTKTAQLAIARGLAETVAGTGVTVNSVLPGPTRSEGVADFFAKMAKDRGVSQAADGGTIRRAEPSHLADQAPRDARGSRQHGGLCLLAASLGHHRRGVARRRRRGALDRMSENQYLFAIGSSSAGNSVITRQPLSVTTTSSSMRAAE